MACAHRVHAGAQVCPSAQQVHRPSPHLTRAVLWFSTHLSPQTWNVPSQTSASVIFGQSKLPTLRNRTMEGACPLARLSQTDLEKLWIPPAQNCWSQTEVSLNLPEVQEGMLMFSWRSEEEWVSWRNPSPAGNVCSFNTLGILHATFFFFFFFPCVTVVLLVF